MITDQQHWRDARKLRDLLNQPRVQGAVVMRLPFYLGRRLIDAVHKRGWPWSWNLDAYLNPEYERAL